VLETHVFGEGVGAGERFVALCSESGGGWAAAWVRDGVGGQNGEPGGRAEERHAYRGVRR
jgi:hypothetical protein